MKEKLVWYAPTWSTVPRQFWVLKKYILSPGPIARISIGSVIAAAVIVGALKLALPAIVIPNLLPMVLMVPGLVVGVVLQTLLLSVLKARVVVTAKRVVVQHGQSAIQIKMDQLTKVVLALHDHGKTRIRFCWELRSLK